MYLPELEGAGGSAAAAAAPPAPGGGGGCWADDPPRTEPEIHGGTSVCVYERDTRCEFV